MTRQLRFLVAVALCAGCAGNPDFTAEQQIAAGSGSGFTVVTSSVPPRATPGGTLKVSLTLKNTSSTTWPKGAVLTYAGEAGWTSGNLALGAATKPNQQGTFTGTLGAPKQIGRWTVAWSGFGGTVTAKTEVTCSDGIFCNGDERYVNGKCAPGPSPCDDGEACTTDTCNEATMRCDHTRNGADCDVCAVKNCNPSCHGAVCGDDGCGGSCGPCGSGQVCAAGSCIVALAPGTCSNPLPIIPGGDPNAALAPGYYAPPLGQTTADNSDGYDEVIPTCDAIPAPEKIFKIVVNQVMGIDAQSFGIDTVLSIYSDHCGGTVVGCNDDAAPPGNYGSHVFKLLQPGSYIIAVNGFDTHAVGPFTLAVRLVAGCVPQCDGKFCGDDGCGGACGTCGTGQLCNSASRCVSDPCVPQCNGRQCGTSGCSYADGTPILCGTCQDGKACDEPSGACKNVQACNHDRPVCSPVCSSQEYCGADCACHRARDPRPDLVVSETAMSDWFIDTLDISPSSCTVVENCVGGTGLRKLLHFTVEAVNQGNATMSVPPPKARPDLFEFSPCHGHYHFLGFAQYRLLDGAGNVMSLGKKLAYCMEDTEQVEEGPGIGCEKKFDCTNQGIQAGWSDIYGNTLDCQWLDVTDVAPGNYSLQVTVNPNHAFEEASFDNNTTTIPVTVQ